MLTLDAFQRLGVLLTLIIHCNCQCPKARFARATNEFGFNLLRSVSPNTQEANLVLSPTGVSTILTIAYAGAGGKTAAQLSTALGYTDAGLSRDAVLACQRKFLVDPQSRNPAFSVADVFLIRSNVTILESYRRVIFGAFATEIIGVNFEKAGSTVASDVNDVVAERTAGQITNIVGGELGGDELMVLLNAAYFNGTLEMPCNKSYAALLPFYSQGTFLTTVETLVCTGLMLYTSVDGLSSQVVELAHTGGRHNVGIVLPRSKTGLTDLRSAMNSRSFRKIRKTLRPAIVSLTLPRFNLTTTCDLAAPFIRLGVTSVFNDADLSGITGDKVLRVTAVRQKARIDVTDESAVFSGGDVETVRETTPALFHVNHPFLFYVRDRTTQRLLFIGLVRQL